MNWFFSYNMGLLQLQRDEKMHSCRASLFVFRLGSGTDFTYFRFLWTGLLGNALRLHSFHLCCLSCRCFCFRAGTFNLIQFFVWLLIFFLCCAYCHVGEGTLNTFCNALRWRSYSWNHASSIWLLFLLLLLIRISVFCPFFLQSSLL